MNRLSSSLLASLAKMSVVSSSLVFLTVGCAAQVAQPVPAASVGAGESSAGAASDRATRYAPLGPDRATRDASAQLASLDVGINLSRLRNLQVFEVLGAIRHIPESANCYSLACPGHEAEFAASEAADARALASFTDALIAADAKPTSTRAPTAAESEADLKALRALSIVEIGALVVEQPSATGHCYGACPADLEAAAKLQRAREVRLANIAHAMNQWSVESSLGRLRSLQVFDVLGAIVHLPGAGNCYGVACPGQEAEFVAAESADATSVRAFADTVVAAASLPVAHIVTTPSVDDANLQTLRALAIVDIGALLVDAPTLTGNCYGVCPADAAAARDAQTARAAKLSNIAHAFAR